MTATTIVGACAKVHMFHQKLGVSFDQPLGQEVLPDLEKMAEELLRTSKMLEMWMRNYAHDKRYLRAHLHLEETAELILAMARGNEVETLDALADNLYILCGTAVTFDLPLAEGFDEVHTSNMTKEKQPADASRDRVRQKGPNYAPPDLARVLKEWRAE